MDVRLFVLGGARTQGSLSSLMLRPKGDLYRPAAAPPTRPTRDAGLGGAAAQHCRLGSPEDLIHDPVASVLYI